MKKIFLSLLLFVGIAVAAQNESETLVLIKTTKGEITVKLYNDTPKHRDNFIKLVKEGWYNGSPFHRVINNFMIQGGQNADGRLDPGYTIEAEFNAKYKHKKGALAAARMGDQVNPERRSSGSQFYIVQNNNGTPHLNGTYTIFGEVLEGLDVIDKIAAVKTGYMDVPIESVTMTMEILE
ncbi:MAG: peptidylprolyl isomerase [Lentimicrobiaceae bacterium]|jgi:cyclophilin family peptidyl-prolyl cis-trans isomerase|nr:peptidylprolyl isomerase [Lentimicrobiaceae bacterium]